MKLRQLIKPLAFLTLVFLLSACVSFTKSHPLVNNLVTSKNYDRALSVLNDNPSVYGKNNQLLYFLDRGFIEHLAQKFEESINTLDGAKLKFDELYTKSISKIGQTWVINDTASPYHGEDFERVLINIFQALNYIKIGKKDDALVEARDVDSKLSAINSQYSDDQKNVYKEDAFARFLMVIIYELSDTKEYLNDAFISYRKAVEIYEQDYADNYEAKVPTVLKENLLTTARFMGFVEFSQYKERFGPVKFVSLKEKKEKAEIYLIQYNGLSPIKIEETVPIPMPDGYFIKVAFPKYKSRIYNIQASRLLARSVSGDVFQVNSEAAENIGAIAIKNLENRKNRFIAKSVARATGRYLVEKNQEDSIKKKFGDVSAGWFRFFSSMFNIIVERSDLRCWQTLPNEIRIARLILAPGQYEFTVENFSANGSHLGEYKLGMDELKAGQKKFFLIHTAY